MKEGLARVEELRGLLRSFSDGGMSIREFLDRLDALDRAGLRHDLPKPVDRWVSEFVVWYADLYDPLLPPRKGMLGRLRDQWDALRGVHRLSTEDVRRAAMELENSLATRR